MRPSARRSVPARSSRANVWRAFFVRRILAWFAVSGRDLPWRQTCDPYAIWVSEIMLQQTQVKTVIPYWQRWMAQFPDLAALAKADLTQVLKAWEGLGYYTRARNLQRAAQWIVDQFAGRFPAEFDQILALPGVGRYTAGAIGSIAFNQPHPILDGNVVRVLTRFIGIEQNARSPRVEKRLWAQARALVEAAASTGQPRAASDFNQGLMELGALVCTPRQPKCPICPLNRGCVAHRDGRTAELPRLDPRPVTLKRRFLALVLADQGRVWIRQRPDGGVNAKLWEFPNIELTNGSSSRAALRAWLGSDPRSFKPLCTVRHSITRSRITLEAFLTRKEPACKPAGGCWIPFKRLLDLPFPSAHKKVLEAFMKNSNVAAFALAVLLFSSGSTASAQEPVRFTKVQRLDNQEISCIPIIFRRAM